MDKNYKQKKNLTLYESEIKKLEILADKYSNGNISVFVGNMVDKEYENNFPSKSFGVFQEKLSALLNYDLDPSILNALEYIISDKDYLIKVYNSIEEKKQEDK